MLQYVIKWDSIAAADNLSAHALTIESLGVLKPSNHVYKVL